MIYAQKIKELIAEREALRKALREVAQAHAWLAFGECTALAPMCRC